MSSKFLAGKSGLHLIVRKWSSVGAIIISERTQLFPFTEICHFLWGSTQHFFPFSCRYYCLGKVFLNYTLVIVIVIAIMVSGLCSCSIIHWKDYQKETRGKVILTMSRGISVFLKVSSWTSIWKNSNVIGQRYEDKNGENLLTNWGLPEIIVKLASRHIYALSNLPGFMVGLHFIRIEWQDWHC